MCVAVVADQLSKRGGAERVFLVMAEVLPGARLVESAATTRGLAAA